MTRLFCPSCSYNLSGSLEANPDTTTCPECGRAFQTRDLAQAQAARLISPSKVLVWLIPLPAIAFVASVIPVVSLFAAPIAGLGVLIGGAFLSRWLARRLALTRAVQAAEPFGAREPADRAFIWKCGAGCWLLQVVLSAFTIFGGCAIAWTMIDFH